MTLKNRLENRIRGWLPQNPKLPIKENMNIQQAKGQNVPIPLRHQGGTRTVTWLIPLIVFFGFFCLFWEPLIININFHTGLVSLVPWVVGGVFAGLAFGFLYAKKELRLLEQTGETGPNVAGLLFFVGAMFVLLSVAVVINPNFVGGGEIQMRLQGSLFASTLAITPGFAIARTFLLLSWERAHHLQIRQPMYSGRLFVTSSKGYSPDNQRRD